MSRVHCKDLDIELATGAKRDASAPGGTRSVNVIRITLGADGDGFYVDMDREVAIAFLKTFHEAAIAAWKTPFPPVKT